MKKNAMLKIAAILMVAVLLTTCAISSTFAKYVTTKETGAVSNVGTVAKWGLGIEVSTTSPELFSASYTKDTLRVESEDTTKYLVAPGTSGQADYALKITGAPQVAYKVYIDSQINLQGWTANGDFYCPLTFKFGTQDADDAWVGEPKVVEGLEYDSDIELLAALELAYARAVLGDTANTDTYNSDACVSATYAPNDSVASVGKDITIYWEWNFEGSNDTKDTALGNADTPASVSVGFSAWAEQIGEDFATKTP